MSYKQIISLILCACIFLTLIACVDTSTSVSSNITVSAAADEFPAATPDQVGLDGQKLIALSKMIEAGDYGDIQSLLIVRDGYIAVENYYQGYNRHLLHFTASVTKSITSLLMGIAIGQGYLDGIDQGVLDKTILELFPEYQTIIDEDPLKQNLLFRHLLTMSSGLEWDESTYSFTDPGNDYYQAYHSADSINYVLQKPVMDDPGTVFHYNGGLSLMLSHIIYKNTGMHVDEFADVYLFNPLGIYNYHWDQISDGLTDTSGGLEISAYDLAKIGYLYVNDGIWKNQQIVSQSWINESTKPWFEAQTIDDFDITAHYGFQWWLLPLEGLSGVMPQENDIYMAWGKYGQFVFAIPSLDMVVVISSDNEETDEFLTGIFSILYDHILRAVEIY
jgi:CubicO group peptidase (beta-lactamase class C family)